MPRGVIGEKRNMFGRIFQSLEIFFEYWGKSSGEWLVESGEEGKIGRGENGEMRGREGGSGEDCLNHGLNGLCGLHG